MSLYFNNRILILDKTQIVWTLNIDTISRKIRKYSINLMFFKTFKSNRKYLEIITMKSPKMSVKRSGKRNIKVLRRNPLRKASRRSNNNIIDTSYNKTNTQSRTPLKTVYTGSITNNGGKNGCYSLSISNSRKRRNESEKIPPSKRRKTINLCETIVLSDDDDDNHHDNVNNNGRKSNLSTVKTKLSRCHDTSDIILLSPSQKITRKTRKTRAKSIKNVKKTTNRIQSSKKPANNNYPKDEDDVCVIWSSACEMPTKVETKSEQADDHGEKYFLDNIGNESNFFEKISFPINTVSFIDQKVNEKECSNNNGAVNTFSLSQVTPENELTSRKLREIVVDGLNVTYGYTRKRQIFSKKGLQLVLDYFQSRGHDVKIFIPQYERSREREFLENWYRQGYVIFTPSRRIAGKKIISHDDRFILDYATKCKGIVVSSDQYRDLWREKREWRETIERRLLPPTFAGDYVMFPEDPLGRSGPTLDEFLRH